MILSHAGLATCLVTQYTHIHVVLSSVHCKTNSLKFIWGLILFND